MRVIILCNCESRQYYNQTFNSRPTVNLSLYCSFPKLKPFVSINRSCFEVSADSFSEQLHLELPYLVTVGIRLKNMP